MPTPSTLWNAVTPDTIVSPSVYYSSPSQIRLMRVACQVLRICVGYSRQNPDYSGSSKHWYNYRQICVVVQYQRPQPRDADAMQLFRLSSLVVVAALVCTDDDWVVRGCWPTHKEDICQQMRQGVRMDTCYCNDDYCNTSSPTSLPSLLLLIPLLVSFLLPHVY
ncbi:hypothetical protein GWK47_024978 [Chionoecetes opilio]|uniref:Uncharacterized protein n=1 Tax=Chionoecetes opilio TaxID=41210 RepID=A0A8J4XKQ0_CHIOP|nr:hypothetical protein GWK47_024978 [Chionoecetes opilio]